MSFLVGYWLKSVAILLESKALGLIGINPERVPVNRHRTIVPLWGQIPEVGKETLLVPSATLTSDVRIQERSSVGFASALRGDQVVINIAPRTWVGDRVTITTFEQPPITLGPFHEISVGSDVSIGPGSSLNGCQVGDSCVVESGCILLPGSVMEPLSYLGAGSVLGPDQTIPSGEYWAGNPAQKIRDLTDKEKELIPRRSQMLRASSADQSESFDWFNQHFDAITTEEIDQEAAKRL